MLSLSIVNFFFETIMSLGSRILELRKKSGMSQQELASKIAISKAQLSRYESKNVQPPADVVDKISQLFNISADFLIKGNTTDIAIKGIHNTELIKHFKKVNSLPEEEQKTILKVIRALLCEYDVRKAYAS